MALLPSNAAALPAYRAELRGVGRQLLPLLAVSSAGAVAGAVLLLVSDPGLFEDLVPFLILLAPLLFAAGDALRRRLLASAGGARGTALIYVALFAVSVYGGFFGAGLGIILLAVAQIFGFADFHVANGVKNLLGTSFTVLGIAVFGAGGLIAWPEAAVMMVGSAGGGYLGGRYARRVDQRRLRAVVIGFGLLLSAVYFLRSFG
jgi:uncharacterized membrane protein YfcA